MNLEKTLWICTDPDNLQYCKKESHTIYSFKEFRFDLLNRNTTTNLNLIKEKLSLGHIEFSEKHWNTKEYWVEKVIDLTEYEEPFIKDCLDTYGYEYEQGEVIDSSGNAYVDNALVAECIFEQETQY